MPKKPKIDFFKYVDNDKKVLRYTARFNTKVPEDVDRRFIISFYLADDTISIFEPAQKNSGIIEGPFLERRKYKNVDKQLAFITPTDMPVGGDIKINGYNFHCLDCDEYTTKYLATHTYAWAWDKNTDVLLFAVTSTKNLFYFGDKNKRLWIINTSCWFVSARIFHWI